MAQLGKGKLNYRCPSCFMRDLDIDMFYNKVSHHSVPVNQSAVLRLQISICKKPKAQPRDRLCFFLSYIHIFRLFSIIGYYKIDNSFLVSPFY